MAIPGLHPVADSGVSSFTQLKHRGANLTSLIGVQMTTDDGQGRDGVYRPTPGAYDEMYDDQGRPRPGVVHLDAALRDLGSSGLHDRGRVRDSHLTAQGITFTLSGRERPLPMDLIPRVIAADE